MEPTTQNELQPSPAPSFSNNLVSAFRGLSWPFLMAAAVQVGALASIEDARFVIGIAQLSLFVYAGYKLHQRNIINRSQAASIGIVIGLALGIIGGLSKFLLWKKFFTLFFLITDPVLGAVVGGLVVPLVLIALQHPKLRSFIHHFIPNPPSHDEREKGL